MDILNLFGVIHEDEDILVVHKPADLVCHPTKGDEYSSLISRARLYLKNSASPHLINRLDRETSGIVLIAKNPTAAGELGKIWETRAVTKEYIAIVHGHVETEQGVIEAPLGKDIDSIVAIKDCVRPNGAAAETEYWVEKKFLRPNISTKIVDSLSFEKINSLSKPFTQLRVIPQTGRKHQIRIHLAHIGHPIVGDKLYGGNEDLYLALVEGRLTDIQREQLILPNHALQAVRLVFNWRGNGYDFKCPLDLSLSRFPNG